MDSLYFGNIFEFFQNILKFFEISFSKQRNQFDNSDDPIIVKSITQIRNVTVIFQNFEKKIKNANQTEKIYMGF